MSAINFHPNHHQFVRLANGATRFGLGIDSLNNALIPLPPLAEQRKIAEILRTWDEAIETAEAELNAKQERKRWLMGKLIDRGSAHLASGSGRTKYRLREITSMASGGTPKTSVPQYFGGNIPWVSISDMTAGSSYIYETKTFITEEGLSNSSARIFNKGTVLFAMYASIGECRIAGLDLTTSQAILGIIPKPTIRSEYLYYYLCRIKESAKSHGQTGTQANLNKGIVGDFEISLPSLGEQDQILEILKATDGEIEGSVKLADSLRSQKRGLMQKLLTGEVRVAA
jgi:type I restriction enzyme S subunit